MKVLLLGLCAFITSIGTIAYATMEQNSIPKKKVVIFMGPPGSGKGTQAKKVSEKLNIPHISTGDLFRENLQKGTLIGHKVKEFLDSGKLVPDEIVVDMLAERVSSEDCLGGYLLDGFPRSIPQTEALEKELGDNIELVVINLEVADEMIVKRIEGRRSCSNCGAIFNQYFTPPKIENICDHCGGKLKQRSDDNAQVVKERLNVYHSQTAPVEKYYSAKGVLKSVNGQQSPDIVFSDLMKILN
ncbi:MAG: adenylate kinase [Chlamydiota bacterium]